MAWYVSQCVAMYTLARAQRDMHTHCFPACTPGCKRLLYQCPNSHLQDPLVYWVGRVVEAMEDSEVLMNASDTVPEFGWRAATYVCDAISLALRGAS